MFKLIKYEYRRNLTGILAMLAAVILGEGYFLWANSQADVERVIGASAILFFIAVLCVMGMLIYSITLYSREMNAKTSYLTFMTPNSATKVLGSKLLAAFVLGVFFAAILGGLAVWDFELLAKTFPELNLGRVLIEQMLSMMNAKELGDILTFIGAAALEFLISFFTTVVVAYLAITLSATVFNSKRFKGILSTLIFAGIMLGMSWLTRQMISAQTFHSMRDVLMGSWPQYAVYAAVMVGSFGLSAWLLEHKVSL